MLSTCSFSLLLHPRYPPSFFTLPLLIAVLGSFQERVRRSPIRLSEVIARNKAGTECGQTSGTTFTNGLLTLSSYYNSHYTMSLLVLCSTLLYSPLLPFLSSSILSYPVLSCSALLYPVLSCLVFSCFVSSCSILSHPVLSCLVRSYLVLFYLVSLSILSHLVLS